MQGIDSDLIRGHIDTIILNILQEGDKYGYEICDEVEKRSKGAYEIKQPTLYSCLKRLEGQGLISSYWLDSDIGGKRHYYKLTDLGLETFNKNQEDWKRSRLIIDSLINSADEPQAGEQTSEQQNITDENEPVDSFIFDKMDEEIESQDNGHEGESGNVLEATNEAEKNGYDEVNDNSPLAFTETDGDHIYEENNEQEKEYNSSDDYDILALLGHTDSPSEPEETVEEEVAEEQEVEQEEKKETISDEELDDLFTNALKYFIETDEVSVKSLQRRFFIGYARASKIMNQMEQKGFVSEPDENNERKLLITMDEYERLYGEKRFDPAEDSTGTQENEILEKFITGKYSEYNPDRIVSEPEVSDETEPENVNEEPIVSEIQPEPEVKEENNQYDDSIFEDHFDNSSNLSYFEKTPIENENNDASESEQIYDYSKLFKDESTYPTQEESEPEESDMAEQNEPEANETPYDDITYYNTDQTYYKSNVIEESDNSYDYNNSDDDAIVMDFSNQTDEARDNEPYNNNEEAENVSEVANEEQIDYQERENIEFNQEEPNYYEGVDTTSVYDKGTDIDGNFTDSSAKEKLNEIAPTFNEDVYNQDGSRKELMIDKTVKGIAATTDDSPKDLSLLKTNFEEEGIIVKPYYKTSIKPNTSTKPFIETNRIKMFRGWIVFFIELVMLAVTMLVCNKYEVAPLTFKDNIVYYVAAFAIIFGIAMIATVRYWFNPYKKVTAKYAPTISHIFALLFTVQFLVIIYCVNLIIGFDGFNQIDYNHLNWIVPSVVSLYPIISSIVYRILYSSHNFHV